MKTIVGKIYANWCGHCQSLKPEWQTMKLNTKNNSNIQFIEIEESQVNKLDRFKKQFPNLEVNGYPTIFKIYPNRTIEYYNGARLARDMQNWATENIQFHNVKQPYIKTAKRKTFRNMNRNTNKNMNRNTNRNMNKNMNKTVKNRNFFGLF